MFRKYKIEKTTNQQMYTRYLLLKNSLFLAIYGCPCTQRMFGCMQHRHTPILVYRPCPVLDVAPEVHHVPEHVTWTHLMV
jgi:hypothetical protein